MAFGLSVLAQTNDSSSPHVDLIVIDGSINPAVDDFIRESIARAKSNGARALIIQLDTPGGLLSSTRTIVKELLSAEVPIMVYVAPSGAGAGSAGVFITMAAHIAAMAPATNIGAAHPVRADGSEVKGAMGEKIENFTASFSESIAQQRGRNTEWAIQAVRKSVSITEKEALKKNVIDIVARDIDDLLKQAHGRNVDLDGKKQSLDLREVRIVRHEMSIKQRIINTIADPNIAYLLMMAGILGLYIEFSHPGVIFPGVAGAICLLLAAAWPKGTLEQGWIVRPYAGEVSLPRVDGEGRPFQIATEVVAERCTGEPLERLVDRRRQVGDGVVVGLDEQVVAGPGAGGRGKVAWRGPLHARNLPADANAPVTRAQVAGIRRARAGRWRRGRPGRRPPGPPPRPRRRSPRSPRAGR